MWFSDECAEMGHGFSHMDRIEEDGVALLSIGILECRDRCYIGVH
jgi:hypothetical protein